MRTFLRKIVKKKTILTILAVLAGIVLLLGGILYFINLIDDHGEYLHIYFNRGSWSLPYGTEKVEKKQFEFCDELKIMTIPNSVTTIEKKAFYACEELRHVNFVNNSQLTTIESYAFCSTQELKKIKLPESLREIKDFAFALSGLTKIEIPEGVTKIGNNVFDGCSDLTTVNIPATLTEIGATVFINCQNLHQIEVHPDNPAYCSVDGILYTKDMTELVFCPARAEFKEFPGTVTKIRDAAFSYYKQNIDVKIPATITEIGTRVFEMSCITSATFAEDTQIKTIPEGMFAYCSGLTQFTIPSSVETIGDRAFEDCRNLDNLIIPENVKSIGCTAFANTGIKQLTLPETVENYDLLAFAGCGYLTKVQLPSNMKVIPEGIFHDCASLTEITIPEGVEEIKSSAFSGCTNLRKIALPDTVTTMGNYVFKDCERLFKIKLSANLTAIPDYAFNKCYMLQSIEIPESVKYIGNSAFTNCCELKEVLLPSQLEYIGSEAFLGAEDITHLTIPASVTLVGYRALSNMSSLRTLVFATDKNQYPNTIIEEDLLSYTTNVTSLTLAPHIKSIGDYAFSYDDIENIYFSGTSDEWRAICKGKEAFPDNALIIFTDTICDIHGGYESAMCPLC